MKKFYILALVAAMFAACATDATEDVAIEAPEILKVSFEESSRIQLDNNKTVWTKGDLVSVFYRSNAHDKYEFQGETGDADGSLKCISRGNPSVGLDKIVAVYPYSDKNLIELLTGNIQAFMPATQNYAKDSYGIGSSIMVSSSRTNTLYMKNVCGWLKVQLKGEGQVVRNITIKGNNGEQVAGNVFITANTAECTLATALNGADGNKSGDLVGKLVDPTTILTKVTLDCGEGVTLGAAPTAFYIGLPPQVFSKGLTVEVACSDGSTMTKSTEKEVVIARNTIQPMATITYNCVAHEVFELAYTTNDGEPLHPLTTEGFGANFVENIFDPATGKGALKFDGRITTIPTMAFFLCSNLTQIELTKDITTIKAEAFSGCTALTVMDIPQGVKSIGNKAFYNCSGMTEITIPSSVTSIGTSSFEGCGGKANINCKIYDGSSSSYGKFYKAKFTEVVIGNSVTAIGDDAFEYCESLTSVTIPDSVTEIGLGAFYGCDRLYKVYYTGDLSAWCKINFESHNANPMYYNGAKLYLNGVELTEVTIPSDMTEIKYTFTGCTSLKSITFHKQVTSIGDYAFYMCTKLTSVTIPNSVTEIGYYAFHNCYSLKEVYCKPIVPPSGGWAMFSSNASGRKIYVPRASAYAYEAASGWSSYKSDIEPYDFE